MPGAGRRVLAQQQAVAGYDRDRWATALDVARKDILNNYYDPAFHGIDVEAHFKRAREKMDQAQSVGQLFGIIAQALIDFDDSHLYFAPPERSAAIEYGWRISTIGDRAFITAVKAGSDAALKGVSVGDEVLSLDGNPVNRQTLWKLQYLYYALRPAERVRFMLASPGGAPRQVDVTTQITPRKRLLDLGGSDADLNEYLNRRDESEHDRTEESRSKSFGDNAVLLWKLEAFAQTDEELDRVIWAARRHKGLVIDLRGDGGGSEETLLKVIGNLFDHDVTVGQIKRRKETKTLVARTRGRASVYTGGVVALIDSESGSAAELLARVIQLEKRGTVIGDRSAGKVMRARFFTHASGLGVVATYGVSVTDADIVMTDGRSLEKVGVTPDQVLLPTASDLAARRDPVLSAALGTLGFSCSPEEAGAVFPPKW